MNVKYFRLQLLCKDIKYIKSTQTNVLKVLIMFANMYNQWFYKNVN